MEQLPLKDIHLPEPLGWWPPPLGWSVLAVLLPILCVLSIFLYKRIRRKTALKAANKILHEIKQENPQDRLKTLIALSVLLRRVAISTEPRTAVASLNGQAWLEYLDSAFKDAPFSQGVGRCLADVQYRQTLPADIDFDELFKLCERWLKQRKAGKFGLFANNKTMPERQK